MNDLRDLIQARLDNRDRERTEAEAREQAERTVRDEILHRAMGRDMLAHMRVRVQEAQGVAEVQMLNAAADVYAKKYPELADEFRALVQAVRS